MARKYLVAPILHPSAVVQGQWHLEPPQVTYLKRVLAHVKNGTEPTITDPSRPAPASTLFPTRANLVEFRKLITNGLSIDIENAGPYLLCVNLTVVDVETWEVGATLVLPFRRRGGTRYWERWEDHLFATQWLYELLGNSDIAKVFHFGVTHDVPQLEEMGFEVAGRFVDTAVLAHAMYTELPLALQWNCVLYLWAQPWKAALWDVEGEKE